MTLRRYTYYIYMALLVALMASCDVHQWPERQQDVPEIPTDTISPDIPRTTIRLSLEYETDFYVWEHRYDPVLGKVEEMYPSLEVFPDYLGASSKYENIAPSGRIETWVRVFPASNSSQCVSEHTFRMDSDGMGYDRDIEVEIPDDGGVYDLVVWSHLLDTDDSGVFYETSDFNRVRLIPESYRGNTDYRDGFRGRMRIDASTEQNGRYVVYMKRPMGKFELVTTDLSEFLDRETASRRLSARASAEDYRVVISFPMYYPSSYSAMDDRLENASTGVSFETRMTVTGESEASLGFEYVLLNNIMDNGVQTSVSVYRMDGTKVAGSSVFTIPMRRDYHTLLRGAFLTMEGSGGVGIDPGFNGDHNITWQ